MDQIEIIASQALYIINRVKEYETRYIFSWEVQTCHIFVIACIGYVRE